jgi:hypothetical protein
MNAAEEPTWQVSWFKHPHFEDERVLISILSLCVVAITAAVVLSLVDSSSSWSYRPWYDPMVVTHFVAVFPLAIAMLRRMYFTAFLVFIATVISVLYHSRHEREDDFHLFADLDRGTAIALFIWTIWVLIASIDRHYDTLLFVVTIVLGGCGLMLYYAPGNAPTSSQEVVRSCRNDKTHPMWHLLSFVAVAMAIVNVNLSKTPGWLSKIPRPLQSILVRG